MPPAIHRLKGLTSAAFARNFSATEAAAQEWQDLPPSPDGTLDATGMTGLRLRCAECGAIATSAEADGSCMCEDCGCEHFIVRRLVQRREAPLPPGMAIRITGSIAGASRFVHIDLPKDAAPDLTVRYTTDGTDPTYLSQEYTRPFRLDKNVTQIRARVYGPDTFSPVLSHTPKRGFSCADCGDVFTLPTGKSDETKCPHCGAAYHKEGSKWLPGPKARKPEPVPLPSPIPPTPPSPRPKPTPPKKEEEGGCTWYALGIVVLIIYLLLNAGD